MNNYTYPVLMEFDSSYKDDISFEIGNASYVFDNDKMNIELVCKLTSEYLKSLISNEFAYVLVTATTVMNKVIEKFDIYEEKINISVPLDMLIDCDNICIQAYVLVKREFMLSYVDEMDDIYKKFKGKKVSTNTQLAISNSQILYYRTVEDSFVALAKTEELNGKGLRIEYNNSDSILIKAGDEFCDAYAAISNSNQVAKEILNCFMAFLGIYYTTTMIKNDGSLLEKIKDYEWYEGYEYLFAKREISVMDFFANDADGIEDVFLKVQELLGNELEATLIRCREMQKLSKGGNKNE